MIVDCEINLLFCIIQLTVRGNCLVLENSPLKLEENLSLGKFFSLLFFAVKIIINLQTDLLSFWKSPFKLDTILTWLMNLSLYLTFLDYHQMGRRYIQEDLFSCYINCLNVRGYQICSHKATGMLCLILIDSLPVHLPVLGCCQN